MPVRKKAPEDLTAKKALALEVIRRLKAEYPDAGCTLDYDHAWQLLVSVRLAAQCRKTKNPDFAWGSGFYYLLLFFKVVPPGIEPGTQGFSVLCSTN